MKKIPIGGLSQEKRWSQGKLRKKQIIVNYALVDDEDFDKCNQYKWSLGTGTYIKSSKIGKLHRFIMNCPDDKVIDHIDHNPLNNQKSNLRICTISQNGGNRMKPKKYKNRYMTSKFKGVRWHKHAKKWSSHITINFQQEHLGAFNSEVEAAKAYNDAAVKHFGSFACLNNIGV